MPHFILKVPWRSAFSHFQFPSNPSPDTIKFMIISIHCCAVFTRSPHHIPSPPPVDYESNFAYAILNEEVTKLRLYLWLFMAGQKVKKWKVVYIRSNELIKMLAIQCARCRPDIGMVLNIFRWQF